MKPAIAYKTDQLMALVPVLLAWLWTVLSPRMLTDSATIALSLGPSVLASALLFLPMFLTQGWLSWRLFNQSPVWRFNRIGAVFLWGLGFILYPLSWQLSGWADNPLWQDGLTHAAWTLAAGLSLLYWWHQAYQYRQRHGVLTGWSRLWSLDLVLCLLLLVWVLAWACLLTSHPPGFASQPIPVRFDWGRMVANPGLWLWYCWQFVVLAAVMFGCYWLTRYVLIRRVLAQQGLLPFALISVLLIAASYAPLSWLLLQLPMNQQVEVPAVPGGSQNPFDWYNFNFMLLQWLLTTPLILAFERQQQDSALAQVRHQQVRTELQLLQQQINPHFLFNTLNNLYALCLLKSEAAPQLVLKLADLMRYVVYQGQQQQVTLQQELAYLQHYIDVQQLRVSNKAEVHLEFPADAASFQLPPLLLIMILENAYKHGVEASSGPSQINLSVRINQHRLVFVCSNTRPAVTEHDKPVGVGLENLRRRLQLIYGAEFVLQTGPDPADRQGWRAELQLPLWPGPDQTQTMTEPTLAIRSGRTQP